MHCPQKIFNVSVSLKISYIILFLRFFLRNRKGEYGDSALALKFCPDELTLPEPYFCQNKPKLEPSIGRNEPNSLSSRGERRWV